MRLAFQHRRVATDEIIYDEERHSRLHFQIGDVRDSEAVAGAARRRRRRLPRRGAEAGADLRVPPGRGGEHERASAPENIVRAIREQRLPVEAVVGVSTDKACKPVNVMGMTKALQERILVEANLRLRATRASSSPATAT